jgi:hypothetical protein
MERIPKTLLASAALLVALGTGNLFYGGAKLREYSTLLSTAIEQGASTNDVDVLDHPLPFRPLERVDRLRQRAALYSYVVMGGKTLLAGGGICLLAFILLRRRRA